MAKLIDCSISISISIIKDRLKAQPVKPVHIQVITIKLINYSYTTSCMILPDHYVSPAFTLLRER